LQDRSLGHREGAGFTADARRCAVPAEQGMVGEIAAARGEAETGGQDQRGQTCADHEQFPLSRMEPERVGIGRAKGSNPAGRVGAGGGRGGGGGAGGGARRRVGPPGRTLVGGKKKRPGGPAGVRWFFFFFFPPPRGCRGVFSPPPPRGGGGGGGGGGEDQTPS